MNKYFAIDMHRSRPRTPARWSRVKLAKDHSTVVNKEIIGYEVVLIVENVLEAEGAELLLES